MNPSNPGALAQLLGAAPLAMSPTDVQAPKPPRKPAAKPPAKKKPPFGKASPIGKGRATKLPTRMPRKFTTHD